jgi:hypothetical protein
MLQEFMILKGPLINEQYLILSNANQVERI